ncbi:hypothetical protein ABF87_03455 [Nitrosomonas sp. JL21]|nr:hypothetical protein [Nitrosomonas sp.]MXS77029.1 hypothetical protein [Nitrosomonas sp. JL21]
MGIEEISIFCFTQDNLKRSSESGRFFRKLFSLSQAAL